MSGLGVSGALATSLVIGILAWPAESLAVPEAAGRHGRPAFGLGSCVAGTYLLDVAIVEFPLTFQALATLGADGTFVGETTLDFGSAAAQVPFAYRSGGRGQWKASGDRRMRFTNLQFHYDQNGDATNVEKINGALKFDHRCTTATAEGTFSLYTLDQDPFGDDPIFGGTWTAVVRRLPVQ